MQRSVCFSALLLAIGVSISLLPAQQTRPDGPPADNEFPGLPDPNARGRTEPGAPPARENTDLFGPADRGPDVAPRTAPTSPVGGDRTSDFRRTGGRGAPPSAEQQKLAEAVRTLQSTESEETAKQEARTLIEEYLRKQFDADLEARKKQLEDLDKQLVRLREQIQKRAEAKDKLVELRMQLLENESLGLGFPEQWSQLPGSQRPGSGMGFPGAMGGMPGGVSGFGPANMGSGDPFNANAFPGGSDRQPQPEFRRDPSFNPGVNPPFDDFAPGRTVKPPSPASPPQKPPEEPFLRKN